MIMSPKVTSCLVYEKKIEKKAKAVDDDENVR